MRGLVELLRRRLRLGVEPPPDPFRTLELQSRLTRLADELEALECESARRFARGHHARAALLAYEQTLDEACALAGLPVPTGTGPEHRLVAEASLLQAGWKW